MNVEMVELVRQRHEPVLFVSEHVDALAVADDGKPGTGGHLVVRRELMAV